MKRAAIYARVSTWEQAQYGYSLGYQLQMLPPMARLKGFTVDENDIYAEASSGANDDRLEYNRMLALIIEGYYQAIFVVEKSRLSRTDSRIEEERIVKSLQKCDCMVITPYATYNPSCLEGEFMWDILSAVDRNERKRIKERNARGKYAKALKGGHAGGIAPTGYIRKWDKQSEQYKYKTHPQKMKPVKLAFKWIQQGYFVSDIANKLFEKGYRTTNARKIGSPTIRYWLTNPHYAGYTTLGFHSRTKGGNTHFFEVNQYLPPIITKEEFQKVQEILKARRRHLDSRSYRYHPLVGIIKCPNCKADMHIKMHHSYSPDGSKRFYYRCNSNFGRNSCNGKLPKTVLYNRIHLLVLELLPELAKFGYPINKTEVAKMYRHLQNAYQYLDQQDILQLRELFQRYLIHLEYIRTGTSSRSYQYHITSIVTVQNEVFKVDGLQKLCRISEHSSLHPNALSRGRRKIR